MKLVMTLLVRDEADIVDEQIAFHLDAGVDFVVATDNRSQDGTTEILERYASEGHLHLIREPGEDLRQSEWVTRMARLAATEFGADWVLNTDADEFWWPQGAGLADVLAAVPQRYGVVRAAWRNFVPRPDDGRAFFERMTARLCTPAFHHHPLSTHSKSAHRAVPDVRIGRGNHEAFGEGLLPLRGWYPLEILHFPVRSLEHCVRKYVTQFVALERNAEKGIPNHMAEAYEAYRAGRLEEFYEPLVVDDDALERGLADGTLAVDTRLRDALARPRLRTMAVTQRRKDRCLTPPHRTMRVSRPPGVRHGVSAFGTAGRGRSGPVRGRGERARGVRPRDRARPARSRISRRASGGSSAAPPLGWDARCGGACAREARVAATRRARPDVEGSSAPVRSRAGRLLVRRRRLAARERAGTRGTTSRTTSSSVTPTRLWTRFRSFEHLSRRSCSGVPMDLGGSVLLEIVLGALYAVSIVAWSATALIFGRLPALLTAVLLLVYPAYATLYHQASSDAIFATGLALWALGLARTLRAPSGWRFAALGAGIAVLVLIRPANQVLLPLAFLPLLVSVAWRRRLAWSAACLVAAVGVLGVWAVAQRGSLRRADRRARRSRLGPLPPRLPRRPDDLARERRRIAAPGRPDRGRGAGEGASRRPRRAARRLPQARVELRDRAPDRSLGPRLRQGRELRRPLRLRARGDPRAPGHVRPRRCRRVLGVPETGAAAGGRRPARADSSGGAASDLRGRRRGVSEPAGARPRRGRSLRVRLVRLRLHRLVHARRPLARSGPTPSGSAATARSSARCGHGMPSCRRATGSTSSPSS